MSQTTASSRSFIGYEYREITVDSDMESMYVDGYQNFGWLHEGSSSLHMGLNNVTVKFKRDRKIRNKAELTRLQRQFDACVLEIQRMERNKASSAFALAFGVGIVGTAFIAGATFAYLAGMIVLCIVLAVPGFTGWALPYFLFRSTYAKKNAKIAPLIDQKYDEIYELCERASALIGKDVSS